MSYVRWSSKVRQGCKTCGDTSYVPLTVEDDAGLAEFPKFQEVLRRTGRLCPDCTSCWYIYASVGDFLSVNHGRCPSAETQDTWQLSADEAATWEPPHDCPMREIAIEAARAYASEEIGTPGGSEGENDDG